MSRTAGGWRRLLPWLLAPAAGALWASAFGVAPQALAPWVALIPLFLLLGSGGRRRGFLLGWLHGIAFWLASIPWIAPTLETFGGHPAWLSWLLLAALALYLGLYTAAFAAIAAPLWRRATGRPRALSVAPSAAAGGRALALALLTLPGLWVALEVLRGWLLTGFAWNLAAYAWTEVPGALALSSWVGAWGVSYLVLFANLGLALALARGRGRRLAPAALGLLLPLLLLGMGGRFGWAGDFADAGRTGPRRPVRLIQPAIYNQVDYDPALTRVGYERLLRMTREACVPGALVVWPESAAWPLELDRDPLFAEDVSALLSAGGCSLLFNSTHREPGEEAVYFNSAYLVDAGGVVARYDKRHLVPFGEYVPLAGVFSFVGTMARNAGSYSPARDVVLLPWGGDDVGTAICFEITFPGEVAELVAAGAGVLVTVTNDAWYGETAAPWQHFRAARWRAAESRRPLLRAAITGVSGVIRPDGSVEQLLAPGEEGVLASRVAGRRGATLYVRAPWAVPALSWALAAFAMLAGARRIAPGRPPGERRHDRIRDQPTHRPPRGNARPSPGVSLRAPG